MSALAERYRSIQNRIQAAVAESVHPRDVHLLAVSKAQPIDAIFDLYHLGQRDFGENYAQELVEKAEQLRQRGCDGIRWHFIGHLQTNKVKLILPYLHSIHSIDSEKLAMEIAKRWEALARPHPLPVLLEVNIDAESSKSGLAPADARVLAMRFQSLPSLELRGLMCIPSAAKGEVETLKAFRRLRELEESCRPHTRGDLSMGMSQDFEMAIREGATHIRVGTSLFGSRPQA